MKYKNLTFFDKYNIETTISSAKIMILFQTNPQKRKDLPIVISILKSEEALFEEELFTCNENPTNRNKLLNLLKNRSTEEFWISSFIETFDKFYEDDLRAENFTHSKQLDENKVAQLIKEFKVAIFDEFINIVFDDLTSLSPNTIDLIIKNSSKINSLYESKIINLISDKIEFYFSKSDDEIVIRDAIDFIVNLPQSVTDNIEIYKSIMYFLNENFFKKTNLQIVNEYFIKVLRILNKQDQQKYASYIITNAHELIDLQNNKKYDFDYLKKQTILLANNYVYYYQNIKSESFSLDEEECELCINYLGYLVSSSKLWYREYLSYIDRLQNNTNLDLIYNFISHMLLLRWNSKFYEGFAAILTKITRFEQSLLEWSKRQDMLKLIKENASKLSPIERTGVPYIIMSDEIKDKINTTTFVDILLCKYYWVYLFNHSLLNDTAISNLKNSVFDRLIFLEDESIFSPFAPAENGLNLKGQFVVKIVSEAPSDWDVNGISVNDYLHKIRYDLSSTYGVSNLKQYASEYENKIFIAKKEARNSETYQIIIDGKNAIENYRKAKEYFINRNYELALNLFNKIKNYKDSETWILKCKEKIKETNYFSALADEERSLYQSAYKKYKALGEYRDSIQRAQENKIRYYVKTVNDAKNYFENKEYEKSLKTLEDIRKEYPEAEILFTEYSEKYNRIRYEEAVILFEDKKYYEARKLFSNIENYLDSKKYLIECNDCIEAIENEKCYQEGLNYYQNFFNSSDEEDIKKAISAFEALALQKYKDSEEKLSLCQKTYETYKHKVKVRLRIILCAILAIVVTIAVAIPVGIHLGYNATYKEICEKVEIYDGSYEKTTQIDSMFEKIPSDFKNTNILKKEIKYKRFVYLLNLKSLTAGQQEEIVKLYSSLDEDYKDVFNLKNKNKYRLFEHHYQEILSYLSNFNGTYFNISRIDRKFKYILDDYKNINEIYSVYKNVCDEIEVIKELNDHVGYSENEAESIRASLLNLIKYDNNNEFLNIVNYYEKIDTMKVILGARFESVTNKYFELTKDTKGYHLYSNFEEGNYKYFGYEKSGVSTLIYLTNENGTDRCDYFKVLNTYCNEGKLSVLVYDCFKKANFTFYYDGEC